MKLVALPHAQFRFRIRDIPRNIVAEFLQRVRPFHAEITTPISVRVNVRHRVRAQLVVMLLGPFRRAEQPGLLPVPRAINNGSLRFPPGLRHFAQRSRLFQNCNLTGNRIFRAIHPAIVMVSANHPFVRNRRARNFRDYVV